MHRHAPNGTVGHDAVTIRHLRDTLALLHQSIPATAGPESIQIKGSSLSSVRSPRSLMTQAAPLASLRRVLTARHGFLGRTRRPTWCSCIGVPVQPVVEQACDLTFPPPPTPIMSSIPILQRISPFSWSALPRLLWETYTEYLWNHQPGSWVGRTASTFRVLALVVVLPVVILTLLVRTALLGPPLLTFLIRRTCPLSTLLFSCCVDALHPLRRLHTGRSDISIAHP